MGPAGITKVPTAGATALLLATKPFAGLAKDQFQDCSTVTVGSSLPGFGGFRYAVGGAVDALFSTTHDGTGTSVTVPAVSST